MRSQRAPIVLLLKEEIEELVGWMEENPEKLRGRQATDVKDEVFANDE